MTPAEQRVLDAARAYRDMVPGGCLALLDAAQALPRTWPPPTVTDNPAEVVQGEVRETYSGHEELTSFDCELDPVAHFTGGWWLSVWQSLPLVSRPGVTL